MAIDTRSPPMSLGAETADYPTPPAPPALLSQAHWGAIFAGALSALGILIVLNLLGLAVGLYVLDPASRDSNAQAATTTAGVWWAISALVALFVGGWVAGRLAGVPAQLTAALHGVVVWALAVIAAVWLVTSTARAAFGGAAGLLSTAGQAVGGVADQAGGLDVPNLAVQPVLNFLETDLAEELRGLPQGARLTPDALRTASQRVVAVVIGPAERQQLQDLAAGLIRDVATSPGDAASDVQQRVTAAFGENGIISVGDRQEAARVLASQLGISVPQARQTIDIWANRFSQAGPRLQQQIQQLQSNVGRTAEDAADAVAGSALWTAIGLLLALAAAV